MMCRACVSLLEGFASNCTGFEDMDEMTEAIGEMARHMARRYETIMRDSDNTCEGCEFCESWTDRDGNLRTNCEIDGDPVEVTDECRTGKRRERL